MPPGLSATEAARAAEVSADYVEIGTLDTLLNRVAGRLPGRRGDTDPTRIEITVAAITAAASGIVAARRVFDIRHLDDRRRGRGRNSPR
ncbi:hypothetical protein [Paracoccus mutanolyticus]|uniref:hypothetical protein n=1 Tax=Paracoccus mutanolyticus TaxID=1499308 RepID=UPI00167278E7|nr:hypothetical protein [Paracoccus mutanolyticus]